MGLGKTIQVIYYIKEMLKDDENSKFLIVVPTSLAYNWDHEFAMFGSNIKEKYVLARKKKNKYFEKFNGYECTNYNIWTTQRR